jgi:site-specific DNA recombinase
MIEAGTSKPALFDVVIVNSFNRFFRDHFECEFYVRKLPKSGVELILITEEMGDDPMHVLMRRIMALFDEYQSKENARHVLRALTENTRHGFWNGFCRRSAIALSPPSSVARRSRRSWKSTRCTPPN